VTAVGSAHLGIDLGTSGLKLTLVDAAGSVVAGAEASYDVHSPKLGHAETDPSHWEAALRCAGRVLAQRLGALDAGISLRAIGVTGQMHGVTSAGCDTSGCATSVGDTDGGWYEMVAIQNGGFALSWVQQLLGLTWDDFVAAAAGSAQPGSAGAVFVPFLTGERGLVASPGSTAGWSGLTPAVGRAELARSAFEGFAFTVRRGMETFDDHKGPVMLCGGGVREPWVRQLLADVLGCTLTYVPLRSASAVGAAVLAARGVGAHLPVVADVVDVEPSERPMPQEAYTHWRTAVERDGPGVET